jgi:PAS domain S-box-containing protein
MSQTAEKLPVPPRFKAVLPADDWLAAIVESSHDAIVSKTLDGVITSWNHSAERLFGYTAAEAVGQHTMILAAPGREDEMPRILEKISRGEKIQHYDTMRRRKDGTIIEISLTVSPIRDSTGRIVGASKIAREVGERKQWERRQALLLRELNHRVKNMLTVIQAIARNTARLDMGIERFMDDFEGRLGAIAAAHDQLVAADWESAVLDDLVRGALGAHVGSPGMRLLLPSVHLSPALASNLALAVHELASNAAKYGALSTPLGCVEMEGSIIDGNLRLIWRERGGPEVGAPAHRGFGTVLLAEVLTQQHGARVDFDWQREGLVCTLILPLEELPITNCRARVAEGKTSLPYGVEPDPAG